MNRRKLLVAFGLCALSGSFGSFAQQPGKIWRGGFLVLTNRPPSLGTDVLAAFP